MKKVILLFMLLFPLCITIHVKADTIQDDVFSELYYCTDNYSTTVTTGNKKANFYVYRLICIDANNHLYMVEEERNQQSQSNVVSQSPFSTTKSDTTGVAFSGILKNSDASIVSVHAWTDNNNRIIEDDIDTNNAYCLPKGITSSMYCYYKDDRTDYTKAIEKKDGNVFNTLGSDKMIGQYKNGCTVYSLNVKIDGKEIECIILLGVTGINYDAYDKTGNWTYKDTMADFSEVMEFYDGDSIDKMDQKYQFASGMGWKQGKYANGIPEEGSIDYDSIHISDNFKSVRFKYDLQIDNPSSAIANDMPFVISPSGYTYDEYVCKSQDYQYDYTFYRSRYRMISINNGKWFDVYNAQTSPELYLKKGLNIIYSVGSDVDTILEKYRISSKQINLPSYVFLIYYDGQQLTKKEESQDVDISDLHIYRACKNIEEGLDQFLEYKCERTSANSNIEYSINCQTAYPMIWINPITHDMSSIIEIEHSSKLFGGYLLNLNRSQEYFDINIYSNDKKNKTTIKVNIIWQLSGVLLEDFSIKSGGELDTVFDSDTFEYYLTQNEGVSSLVIRYRGSNDSTIKVYGDRKLLASSFSNEMQQLRISKTTKELRIKLSNSQGYHAEYIFYLTRDLVESGISNESKQRAEYLIRQMIVNGYKEQLKTVQGGSYWVTFGAAALGIEYLDGLLGYDITKHSYKQATDYAAVILELIMSGENPYDFLGVNYVEQLMQCMDENGNFGPYSCNIWALSALQAAGAEVPQKTINIVKGQALSEKFDLDMRGWAMYAISPYLDELSSKQKSRCIQSLKNVQIIDETIMNDVNVSGCFENSFYTNRNIMSHACTLTGLVSWGIDPANYEFKTFDSSDPIDLLERYQLSNGGWYYSPENTSTGGWNKDVVIAVGDIYNGSNVYTRYYLTEDRYKTLIEQAEELLSGEIADNEKRDALQAAYDLAVQYVSEGDTLNIHGAKYYDLQEAIYAVDQNVKPGVFLGTAEERTKVANVISLIEGISSYSYADKDKLDNIKNQYDSLKEERLYHYIYNADILDKAYGYIEGIDKFLEAAKKIGKVNVTKTAKIQKAQNLYDSLNEKQKQEKSVLDSYKILCDAQTKLELAKSADKVTQAINYLGSYITRDSADDIESVRAAYEQLTDEEKSYVPNYDQLLSAEEKLQELFEQEEHRMNAEQVIELIDRIGDVNVNSESNIQEARAAYDRLLTDEERNMVGNYHSLLDAEIIYSNLVYRRDVDDIIDMVSYKINCIDNAYGYDDLINDDNYQDVKDMLQETINFINEAGVSWPYIKQMVYNYPRLVEIEAELVDYQWTGQQMTVAEDFIQAVDEIESLNIESEPLIRNAENIWNLLSTEDQEYCQDAYLVLTQMREEMNQIHSTENDVQDIIVAILRIGEINLSENEFVAAKNIYDELSEDVRERIPAELVSLLEKYQEKYSSLKSEEESITRVVETVEQLADFDDLSDEKAVTLAREKYNSLECKEKVSNYLILIEAEYKVITLKKEKEDGAIAKNVMNQIDSLKNVTKKDVDKVESVRREYDALTDHQKEFVTNLSVLEEAERYLLSTDSDERTDNKQPSTSETTNTSPTNSTKNIVLKKKTTTVKTYLTGKTMKYTLILNIKGKNIPVSKIKWKTSKKTVATVSGKGIVTIKKNGKVTITASYKGKKYSCKFTIKKASLKVKQTKITLKKGETKKIKVSCAPKGTPKYKSMNTKIATVDKKGIIKAKHRGKTKIKVIYSSIVKYVTVKVY